MSSRANYISQTNHSHEWKLLLNIQQNKKIYKPPFWQIHSRSYLSCVANYHFLLHAETQTNPIYDGASMTNLSTNVAVEQHCGGSIWNLTLIGPVVSEEKLFENVDIHTYGWQRPTISSPLRLWLMWANNELTNDYLNYFCMLWQCKNYWNLSDV